MTHFDFEKELLRDNGEDSSAQNGKTYQLYTLYRDKNGNIRQVPDFFFFKLQTRLAKQKLY